jgi:hypothetical protein
VNNACVRRPRLAAVLMSLLLVLGLLATFQFTTPQVAGASSRTAAAVEPIPVVSGGLIAPNFRIIPMPGHNREAVKTDSVTSTAASMIEDESCTSARSTWVHVYPIDDGIFCLGFAGTWTFNGGNGRWATDVNFGNNYGNITFEWHGAWVYENFDEGSLNWANPSKADLWTLTISGWNS